MEIHAAFSLGSAGSAASLDQLPILTALISAMAILCVLPVKIALVGQVSVSSRGFSFITRLASTPLEDNLRSGQPVTRRQRLNSSKNVSSAGVAFDGDLLGSAAATGGTGGRSSGARIIDNRRRWCSEALADFENSAADIDSASTSASASDAMV